MTKRIMDTVPCLRGTDGKVPGCCSNKAGLSERRLFLSLLTCQSSPHVSALPLRETSGDIYTPTNKLVW